jgi:hypothetical protein
MMPKQRATITSAGGIQFDVDLSMLEPSEKRAIRKAQNITLFKWAELKTRVGTGRAKALKIAGMEP